MLALTRRSLLASSAIALVIAPVQAAFVPNLTHGARPVEEFVDDLGVTDWTDDNGVTGAWVDDLA